MFTATAVSSPATSQTIRPPVFVVGAPRSGTTWLQRLLGSHPAVATTQETDLVNRYVTPWYDAWDRQLPSDAERWQRQRHRGLPAILTKEEFDGILVGVVNEIYAKVLALKPAASVVVDKNPDYSLHVGVIRRVFPCSPIIHIVRDGRDVAASLVAASTGWGREWAPRRLRWAAQTWRDHVATAITAAETGPYLQVRYEDLALDGTTVLRECFAIAGVVASHAECAALLATARSDTSDAAQRDPLLWSGEVIRRLGEAPVEPPGFFGGGSGSRWPAWAHRDRLEFDAVAGELLRELGYVTSTEWLDAARARRALSRSASRLSAAIGRTGWRAHKALGRRGLYVHVARIDPYE